MPDFLNVNEYIWFILLIGGSAALALGSVIWFLVQLFRGRMDEAAYKEQLDDLTSGLSDEDEILKMDHGKTLSQKWIMYWQKIGKSSGMPMYEEKDNKAPRDAILFALGTFLLINFLLRDPISGPIVGLVAAGVSLYGLSFFLKMKFNREMSKINDQLPGFLFALQANLDANETPVRAIIKVVDNMSSPLKDDLIVVKQKLLANSSFVESLEALIVKTTSGELKFLAACLIQAADSGADIVPQIDIIKDVLEQRKAAAAELNKAIKATLPTVYIGTFAIPGSLAAAYFIDAAARDFWFKEFYSWVALAAVLALWGTGMIIIRKMVEKIKNL